MIASHAALDEASRRLMMDIGPVWGQDIQQHRNMVLDACGPVLEGAPKAGVKVTRDIAYGWHARQILDCFVPAGATNAPVVVFVHGGVFVRGDKRASSEVYDNVLYWFARQGFIGINIEYRLAPESPWPGGAEDLGLAIAWARANLARHGGDPDSIFAMGHSAGGTHVGTPMPTTRRPAIWGVTSRASCCFLRARASTCRRKTPLQPACGRISATMRRCTKRARR